MTTTTKRNEIRNEIRNVLRGAGLLKVDDDVLSKRTLRNVDLTMNIKVNIL
jgi:hypothetical protein